MKHLIITALLVLMATSCNSSYITVMDTEDGKISTVKKTSYDITKVNDTLVLITARTVSGKMYSTHIYGKFINKLPQNTNRTTYTKVVRLR